MWRRHDYGSSEKRSSRMFPIWVILFGICAILVYLTIGGALPGESTQTTVFLPHVAGD